MGNGNSSVPTAPGKGPHAEVAQALGHYFGGLHECDVDRFKQVWHPEGHLYGVSPEGTLVDRDAEAFYAALATRGKSTEPNVTQHDRILSVVVIDDHLATAKVQIVLPPSANSAVPSLEPTRYTDFLVLLREKGSNWRIISKAFAAAPADLAASAALPPMPLPEQLAGAGAAAWEGYLGAGRRSDGLAMARVFHPAARLTYVAAGTADLGIVTASEFCRRVSDRWTSETHRRYAHLRDDPRAASGDALVSVDMAGPAVALVTLRIGYPPLLYTDFLTLLHLPGGVPGGVCVPGEEALGPPGAPGWWIVAKSSCGEPFFAELGQDR